MDKNRTIDERMQLFRDGATFEELASRYGKVLDRVITVVPQSSAVEQSQSGNDAPAKEKAMKLVFTKSTTERKSTAVVFAAPDGVRGSVRIPKSMFTNGEAPETIEIENDAFVQPKAKLTKEQRAEARKNAPKLTAAEKLAKLTERMRKLQAKIDAGEKAPAPVTE